MADERLFQRYHEVLTPGTEDLQDALQAKNKLVRVSFKIISTLQDKPSYQHSQGHQKCLSRWQLRVHRHEPDGR